MGDPRAGEDVDRYSVREVSELLDLSPRQVRAFVADGVLEPTRGARGRYLFSFRDLVVLRAIADLMSEGVPVARIRSAVASLGRQLPPEVDLAQARLDARGGRVAVHLDSGSWEPDSGQTILDLDLDLDGMADLADAAVEARSQPIEGESAVSWYVAADTIEATDPAGAEDAYRTAIELDPGLAEAHLNLGRLLHAGGAIREALDHYRTALGIHPDDATTLYNIGVASQDLGHDDEAIAAYERAIELAPRFADARYNLATLYERSGDEALAVQHLREYRDLVEGR
jgi:tetratricopeptide (TPR) repeat protein